MTQLQSTRSFTDAVGVEWAVREIGSPKMSQTLAKLLEHDRRSGGWLVFESNDGEKRRLAPYPPDWRTVSGGGGGRGWRAAERGPPRPARRKED
jgi:hypothetical protein